jgi:hypothetical protein
MKQEYHGIIFYRIITIAIDFRRIVIVVIENLSERTSVIVNPAIKKTRGMV